MAGSPLTWLTRPALLRALWSHLRLAMRLVREPVYHCVRIAVFDLERDEPLHQRDPLRIAYVRHHRFTALIARLSGRSGSDA